MKRTISICVGRHQLELAYRLHKTPAIPRPPLFPVGALRHLSAIERPATANSPLNVNDGGIGKPAEKTAPPYCRKSGITFVLRRFIRLDSASSTRRRSFRA